MTKSNKIIKILSCLRNDPQHYAELYYNTQVYYYTITNWLHRSQFHKKQHNVKHEYLLDFEKFEDT